MYPASDELMALFESGARQVVTITGATDASGNAVTLTEADLVQGGLVVDRYSSTGGNMLEFGTAVAAECSINLFNADGRHEETRVLGNELYIVVGIADRPDLGTIPLGYFTMKNVQRTRSSIVYTGYDRMVNFNTLVPWKTVDGVTTVDDTETGITSPMVLKDMVSAICTYIGVPLGTDLEDQEWGGVSGTFDIYPSHDYSCTVPYQDGLTFRTIIQWAATIMGTNAYIDYNGTLKFKWQEVANLYEPPRTREEFWNTQPVKSYLIPDGKRFSSELTYRSMKNLDDPEYFYVSGISYADKNGVVTFYELDGEYAKSDGKPLSCGYCPLILGDDQSRILYKIVGRRIFTTRIWRNTTGLGPGGSTEDVPEYWVVEADYGYVPFEAQTLSAPWLFPMDAVALSEYFDEKPSTLTHVTYRLNGGMQLRAVGQEITNFGAYTNAQTENYVNAKITDVFTPVLYINKDLPAAGFGISPTRADTVESAYTFRSQNCDYSHPFVIAKDGTEENKHTYHTSYRSDTNYAVSFGINPSGRVRGIYDGSTTSSNGLHDWLISINAYDTIKIGGDLPIRQLTTYCATGLDNIIAFAKANRPTNTEDTQRVFCFHVDSSVSGGVSDDIFGTANCTVFAKFSSDNYGWVMCLSDRQYVPWAMAVVNGGTTYGWYTLFATEKTQTLTGLGKTWTFRKVGKTVFVNSTGDATTATSGYNLVGTLDADMRPIETVGIPCVNTSTRWVYIGTDGKVQAYTPSAISSGTNFAVSGSYEANVSYTNGH